MEKSNIEITEERNIYPYLFRINSYKYNTSYIFYAPTGNCQTFSISRVNSLLDHSKKDLDKLFKYIQDRVGKKILFIDINEKNLKKFKTNFKRYYKKVRIKRYTSGNGSKMVHCIVELDYSKI